MTHVRSERESADVLTASDTAVHQIHSRDAAEVRSTGAEARPWKVVEGRTEGGKSRGVTTVQALPSRREIGGITCVRSASLSSVITALIAIRVPTSNAPLACDGRRLDHGGQGVFG